MNEIDIDLKKEDLPELQNEFENFGDDYTYSEMISIREWITDKMNKLEVPRIRIYNNSMMNKKIKAEHQMWVDEAISKFYWDFADDLSDESGERLDALLNGEFKEKMLKILEEEYKSYSCSSSE